MHFEINKSIQVLEWTPYVLQLMLNGLSDDWIMTNEGQNTWSVYDIIGHLIHGEKTDWIPRMEVILSEDEDKQFEPFDRFAQFNEGKEKDITQLLEEFAMLRKANMNRLRNAALTDEALLKIGIHPVFGSVTLSQLLATWTVHDLNHIAQIARVMAKQYKEAVGPWIAFLRILQQ